MEMVCEISEQSISWRWIRFRLRWMFGAHMLHECSFLFIGDFTYFAPKILTTFFDMCFKTSNLCVFDTSAKRTTKTLLTIKLNAGDFGQLFNIHGQEFISGWISVWRKHVYKKGKRDEIKMEASLTECYRYRMVNINCCDFEFEIGILLDKLVPKSVLQRYEIQKYNFYENS